MTGQNRGQSAGVPSIFQHEISPGVDVIYREHDLVSLHLFIIITAVIKT